MCTGKHPFGDSKKSSFAKNVLRKEPDYDEIPYENIKEFLKIMLIKDREE